MKLGEQVHQRSFGAIVPPVHFPKLDGEFSNHNAMYGETFYIKSISDIRHVENIISTHVWLIISTHV